jgi:hypothetical protein
VEEFKEVRLVLDEHALSGALDTQGILGLRKVCGVREEYMRAVKVYYSSALNVDAYYCFCLE